MGATRGSQALTVGRRILLRRSYEGAVYRINLPDGAVFLSCVVGRRRSNDGTLDLFRSAPHRRPKADRAAIVTAYNPGSRLRAAVFNRIEHRCMVNRVRRLGYYSVPSAGLDPDGSWPDEPGLCIFGCSRDTACALAKAFGQAAFVWIVKDQGAAIAFA